MIRKGVRIQLIAFAVLAAVGVVYAGVTYAGLGRLFVATTYTVEMRMDDSGGIFTNAAITYRGVNVGRVGQLHPTRHGVVVDLEINKDAPAIPATGLRAEVRNLSVIGELYVNLVPTSGSGPMLANGSTIPPSRTSIPVPPAELLSSVNELLRSVPRDALQTVVAELDTAFSESGPELQRLLDSAGKLVRSAQQVLPETRDLIQDGRTVLDTQNATAESITSFSKSLRALSKQLEKSDPDLRKLIDNTPRAANEVSALLRESGPGISRLLADLLTTSRLALPRQDAVEQLLVTYPLLSRAAHSAVPGDGYVHFGLVLNVFNPLPCVYEDTTRRPGSATSDVPVNKAATCEQPVGSSNVVRGSHNAPHNPIPAPVPAPVDATESGNSAASPDQNTSREHGPVPVTSGTTSGSSLVSGPAEILER